MTFVIDVIGRAVAIEFDTKDAEQVAREVLEDLVVDAAVGVETIRATGTEATTLLASLVGSVNLAVVHFGAGHLMPHAAAVAHPDGSVTLLCGVSGSGKSTLTTALLRQGCSYLTDETSIIEPDALEVLPFRKPLSLKSGSHDLYPDLRPSWASEDGLWFVPAGAINDAPLPDVPLEVRMLVFPRYDADVEGIDLQISTPGDAAYLVGSQSSRLREIWGGPLGALSRLARRAPAYHLHYSDADLAADEVLHLWPR